MAEHFKGIVEIKQTKSEQICDISDKIIYRDKLKKCIGGWKSW